MAHRGFSEVDFLVFLDQQVPLLLALLIATLWLFTRWLETGDRSAYAVGAAAAVLTPVLLVGMLLRRYVIGRLTPLPVGLEGEAIGWVLLGWAAWILGLVLLLAILWFTIWPLTVTGLFLFAPQGRVRRRFKGLETSWQFAVAALLAVKAADLLFELIEPYW